MSSKGSSPLLINLSYRLRDIREERYRDSGTYQCWKLKLLSKIFHGKPSFCSSNSMKPLELCTVKELYIIQVAITIANEKRGRMCAFSFRFLLEDIIPLLGNYSLFAGTLEVLLDKVRYEILTYNLAPYMRTIAYKAYAQLLSLIERKGLFQKGDGYGEY